MGKGINFLEGGPGKVVEVDLTENSYRGFAKLYLISKKLSIYFKQNFIAVYHKIALSTFMDFKNNNNNKKQ